MQGDSPAVSIVIPIYNAMPYIADVMKDVINQTFDDIEVICIDDGSTDGSAQEIDRWVQNDPRMRVVHQENQGVSFARNTGLKMAIGEYVMFLDADDRFAPQLIEKLHSAAEERCADIAVCQSIEFDTVTEREFVDARSIDWRVVSRQEVITPQEVSQCLFRGFMGWPWDKLYKRSLLEECGVMFPDLPNSEDLVFVYAALVNARKIALVDETLIRHRMMGEQQRSNSRESAPTAFYDAICLLKSELEQSGKYPEYEYAFLNWALDYTQWNIKTLPFGDARKKALSRLFEKGYPVLEWETRGIDYYTLYPRAEYNMELLRREYQGKPNSRPLLLGIKSLLRK